MSSRARIRPRHGEEFDVAVARLAHGGEGIGRLLDTDGNAGMAVFIPRSAPGDQLRVRLGRVQRRHAEATVVSVVAPGPGRVEPTCAHYEQGCGGCSWQHLDYATQLAAKQAVVSDSLERIGGFKDLPMLPIVASEKPWFYRNKMEFSFNANDGLGLHMSGDWRRIVPVTECRLESELAMRIVEFARQFAEEHGLSSWDPVGHTGFLRELVVRHGRGSGETMVALVTSAGAFPAAPRFAEGIAALDASIVSVLRATRGGSPDESAIDATELLAGRETIVEQVAGLSFNIGLQTFFQTSTAQAGRMLEIVKRQVATVARQAPTSESPTRILDVFCGVGFFTLGLAGMAEEVIGVEIVEPSIVAARENALLNNIDNAFFYPGDARRTLPQVIDTHGAPNIVVLDPPRSGAGGKVMRRIARTAPQRIVYVSCNPTTLARDLKELEPFGYRITEVQAIDLFPQTYHVETIVALDRVAAPEDAPAAD